MRAILRTHGGLGNQLFQVLYGRLFADTFGIDLLELHDARYEHCFPRSTSLRRPKLLPARHERVLSSLRLPKVLHRFLRRREDALWLFGAVYLDGYFQETDAYAIFESKAIARHLRALAAEISIQPAHIDQCLVHLRVGDFFRSRSAARDHVAQRLYSVSPNSLIVTNDEDLLTEPSIAALLAAKNCNLVSTAGFRAEEVLRLMAAYRRLDANDSTLVFWASVFAGCQTHLRHSGLRATRELFADILRRYA